MSKIAKIQTALLAILILFTNSATILPIQSATASEIDSTKSNYTPERLAISFNENMPGLPYNSFNNFTNNPNIPGDSYGGNSQGGDERKFLVGRICKKENNKQEANCNDDSDTSKVYYNTPKNSQSLDTGDVIRFSIYFHNNGQDPYIKNLKKNASEEAQNVKIGIDLNNITEDSTTYSGTTIAKPQGFIYADNNEYRNCKTEDISSNYANCKDNAPSKDSNGNTLRTATDDMQLILPTGTKLSDFEFTPIDIKKESILLDNKNSGYTKSVIGKTDITFKKDSVTTTEIVTATPHIDGKKMYLQFSQLPGCFRYSGFVYFDVKVVKKVKPAETQNICKSLSVQIDNTKDQIDNKKVYKYTPIFQWDPSKPTDTEQTNMDVRWTSDDPDGKFYSQIPTDAQYKYKYEDITENDNTGKLIIPPQTTQSLTTQVYYTGKGKVHAKLLADNKFRPGNCTATVTIPTIPPVCSFLNVNYQDPVYSGFTSLFSAQGADKYHQPFDSNIEYWVDDDYGTFSATIPKDQEFNPAKTIFQIKGTGPLDLTKAYIPPISGKDIGTAISNKSLPLDLFTQLISTGKLWEITSAPPSTPKIETVPTQPKKQTLPPPQPINGVTQKLETKLQLPDLIKAGSFSPPSNTETIDTTGLQTKMSYDLQPGAIHANAKTTVYFTAKKPSDGKKVIHVKALNSAKGICEQDYPIEPYQVCKSLSVNKQKTIYAQTLSTFSAKSTDKKDKTFNGKITYSVEEGYGMFYTTQQTGKTGNTSPDDPAFTKDLNQKEPKAGFCENQTLKINELKDAPTNFTQELLAKPDTAVTIELLSNETEKLPYATTPENYTVITKTKPETATKPSNITQKQEGISVVADPQDTVYFWGEKQGKEVIHISTNCTSGCSGTFDIEPLPKQPKPKICEASGITATDVKTNQQVKSLKQGEYLLNVGFYTNKEKTEGFAASDKITVKWASSDPNGKFFKTLTDKTEIGVKGTKDHPVTGSLTIKYVGTGTITADLDTYNGHKYEGKACQATLFPYTNRCSSISLTSHPANPKAGDTIDLSLTSTTLYGTPLPPDTNIDFSSNTKGTFISQKGHKSQDTITAPIKDLPLKLNTKQEGTITAQINDKSPLNNPICKSDLAVKPLPEETLVCKELTPKIFEYPAVANSPKATDLKPNKIYEVSGYSTYSKQNPNSAVDYSIDEHYGTFLKLNTNNTELDPAILFTILNGISANTLTPDTLETLKQHYKGLDFSPTFSNVPDNQTVILLTYDLSESTNISVLRMRSTGFFNSECDKSFNIAFRPKMCQSLVLDTIHNGAFDPSQDSILTLKGDFADHQGEIEVKVLGIGTLSKLGSSYRSPTIYFTKDEIKDASTLSFVYNKSPAYDPTKDTVEIVAEAVGDPKLPENQCKSALRKFSKEETFTCRSLEITNPKNPWDTKDSDTKQLFEINVETTPKGHEQDLYYHWQVDGKGDFAKDLTEGVLNNKLGNFDEGTKVSVWASKDKNDPKSASLCSDSIKAKTTTAPQFKKLVYPTGYSSQADSIINIGSKDSSTKKYKSLTYALIFDSGTEKSVDIKESSLSNGKIDGNQGGYLDFTDMTIDAVVDGTKTILLDTDSKLSDYEDNYKCKSGKINLCIEGNFNTAVENFKNGKAITFNNIEPNTRIKLEFQAENLSKIDNNLCKTLKATKGCGEEFDNKALFTSPNDSGKDTAKVIVICPYILSRQGGDTFFNSALDTGVDVAKCSEVKSSTGPIITPLAKETLIAPKTGQGSTIPKTITLDLPSHDICRYSNSGENIEGYNDVLKNFSSTICELKAEVASKWLKENIIAAIKANVDRISRWEGNLNSVNQITDIQSLSANSSIDNKQSGVFVKTNGDLVIDLGNNKLSASGDVPAAQTYIVKGHNLIIKSNIKYEKSAANLFDQKSIPSAAFIVIDGNIVIDNSVENIDGVVMAVDTNGNGDGKITNGETNYTTENRLTINGNLIGNVYELFVTRLGVGDPTRDEGSVTVKYDERILLNTPPGIGELINISQSLIPN